MKEKMEIRSWKISRPDGSGLIAGSDEFIAGMVATPHGYVRVYCENGGTCGFLRVIHRGRIYQRDLSGSHTVRGLVTLAAQFARQVVEGEATE